MGLHHSTGGEHIVDRINIGAVVLDSGDQANLSQFFFIFVLVSLSLILVILLLITSTMLTNWIILFCTPVLVEQIIKKLNRQY